MIDSHCHLTDSKYNNVDAVLSRAAAAGVTRMITIGVDPEDNSDAINICRKYSNVRCSIGIHPNYCHEADESELARLREVQADPAVVGLGEMGLDYHHHFAPPNRQKKFFRAQLELAVEVKKPVVIHCREAVDDCLAILREFSGVPIVFHSFTGTIAEGERILEMGYLIGFAGVVTFKKSDDLKELAKRIPAERFLIETDAPYLTPEPMRKQKINEPAMIVHTAAMLASLRGISIEEIDQITTQNAERFFRLK